MHMLKIKINWVIQIMGNSFLRLEDNLMIGKIIGILTQVKLKKLKQNNIFNN